MVDILVMILAGGRGERLHPLTRDRAKPAVPFGGRYRIIDFVLSNFINSGFFRVKVLTQYRSNSLLIHLARGFNFGSLAEHYVDAIPAHQGVGDLGWYLGTADAIYQNLSIVHDELPKDVAVLGDDHDSVQSSHDFGKDVIPAMVGRYPVYAYNFLDNVVPGESDRERGYWRDVGTVDSYFDATMDLRSVSPLLNLYNHAWPIRSVLLQYPPVKFVFDQEGRCGMAVNSIIANGAIISG